MEDIVYLRTATKKKHTKKIPKQTNQPTQQVALIGF